MAMEVRNWPFVRDKEGDLRVRYLLRCGISSILLFVRRPKSLRNQLVPKLIGVDLNLRKGVIVNTVFA